MSVRLERLRGRMAERGLDGVLLGAPEPLSTNNIRYLSGFTEACTCYLIVGMRGAWLFTDPRFTELAPAQAPDCEAIRYIGIQGFRDVLSASGMTRLGFEADKVSVDGFGRWREAMPAVEWEALNGLVEELRLIKDADEIQHIRRAAELADQALLSLLPDLRGRTEVGLAAALETAMKEAGLDGPGFPTIVGSGLRSYLPHSRPTPKTMQDGEIVLIDFGGMSAGYRSDETVTVALGEVRGRIRDLFDIVFAAQEAGIRAIRPGVNARAVDAACRELITKAGYGPTFRHGTGHGVGLDIHERPFSGREPTEVLEEGMTLTVEPGIYLPDVGGVRLEDTFVVTATGAERLTTLSKEWRVV